MRYVLDRSGTVSPSESPPQSFSFYDSINSDPLLNFEFAGASRKGDSNIQLNPPTKDICDGTLKDSSDPAVQTADKNKSVFKSVSLDDRSCAPNTCPVESTRKTEIPHQNVNNKLETQPGMSRAVSLTNPQSENPENSTTRKNPPHKISHKRCQSDVPFIRKELNEMQKENPFSKRPSVHSVTCDTRLLKKSGKKTLMSLFTSLLVRQ